MPKWDLNNPHPQSRGLLQQRRAEHMLIYLPELHFPVARLLPVLELNVRKWYLQISELQSHSKDASLKNPYLFVAFS